MNATPEPQTAYHAPLHPNQAPPTDSFTERVTAPQMAAPPPTYDYSAAHPETQHAAASPPERVSARREAETHVADGVVAHIAAAAAREIPGVYALVPERGGDPLLRLLRRLSGRKGSEAPGVHVQVGRDDVLISLALAVQFGVSIPRVVDAVRANVTGRVQTLSGLRVRGVKIEVVDLHFPEAATGSPPS